MSDRQQENADVLSTWTDELNNALDPLGILLSGVDAASIWTGSTRLDSVLDRLRSLTEDDIIQIAHSANAYCETDQIHPRHIQKAVEGTKWHYQDT
jgi:hypothetical protein